MNYEDRNESNYSRYRAILHLSMGVIYLAMSAILFSRRIFPDLDPKIGYAAGGLMLVYGLFRLWRGLQDMRMNRR